MAAVTVHVILETKKIKSVTVSIFPPSICHKVMGLDARILVFWVLSFKPAFPLSSFTFIKRLFSFSLPSTIRVVVSAYLRWLILLRYKLCLSWAAFLIAKSYLGLFNRSLPVSCFSHSHYYFRSFQNNEGVTAAVQPLGKTLGART